MIMNLKSIWLHQVNMDGQSQALLKLSANDSSGIFKDFAVCEHASKANEFVVLVACADGRVYYHEFNTQNSKEEVVLTSFIAIPAEFVPKG